MTPHRTTIYEVAEAVCNQFGIEMYELQGKRRTKLCKDARLVLCYVAHDDAVCVTADADIARWLGRDRSTVTHARKAVRKRLERVDTQLMDDIMAVRNALVGETFNDMQEQCK